MLFQLKNLNMVVNSAFELQGSISSMCLMPAFFKSKLHIFSLITVWLGDFLAKEYRQKSARKMLMK